MRARDVISDDGMKRQAQPVVRLIEAKQGGTQQRSLGKLKGKTDSFSCASEKLPLSFCVGKEAEIDSWEGKRCRGMNDLHRIRIVERKTRAPYVMASHDLVEALLKCVDIKRARQSKRDPFRTDRKIGNELGKNPLALLLKGERRVRWRWELKN